MIQDPEKSNSGTRTVSLFADSLTQCKGINCPRAATSLHYVHYSRAQEGVTDLVLANSMCVQCVGGVYMLGVSAREICVVWITRIQIFGKWSPGFLHQLCTHLHHASHTHQTLHSANT